MSYHDYTFRILSTELHESMEAIAAIDRVEKRLGFDLPPSVREWYSNEDAIHILASYSNNDQPLLIDDFALVNWESDKLLLFKLENQGVCEWAIMLDGSDDPPVFVKVDRSGWRMQTPKFSEYVFSCVWDYAVALAKPGLLQAQNKPVSRAAIEELSTKFSEKLRSHGWPGDIQYRFESEKQAILIWSSEDQSDWFVSADDTDALRSALEMIWHLDDVGQSLYECTAIGKDVLESFKGKS